MQNLFIFTSIFLIQNSFASIKLISTKNDQISKNHGVDELVDFRISEMKKKTTHHSDPLNPGFNTDVRVILKTKKVEDLEKFIVVRFIKGCMYRSYIENGELVERKSIGRTYLGEPSNFSHSELVVDSEDLDPSFAVGQGSRQSIG